MAARLSSHRRRELGETLSLFEDTRNGRALPALTTMYRHAGLSLAAVLVVAMATFSVPESFAQDNAAGGAQQNEPLVVKRDATEAELKDIAKSISRSTEKAAALEAGIAEIEKSRAVLRAAIVDLAARRQDFERKIRTNEKNLAGLAERETSAKASLLSRRGVLAEVLAALQRMGRNPPPALLVSPDDALSSVRSAILLGAVVPGIRKETDKLAADLATLAGLHRDIVAEKENYVTTMASLSGGRTENEPADDGK